MRHAPSNGDDAGVRPEISRLKPVRCRWPGRRFAALALVAGAWLLPARATVADFPALEYKVKAGYLFNFAKFIEWPAGSFPTANSPFVIGVLDGGATASVLESILQGKLVEGRAVQVRAVTAENIGRDLHILLVTRTATKSVGEIRAALSGAATLLVGETAQFAELGGTVGFTREVESIRLSLNLERAVEAGLKVSAKLSTVAKLVKTKPAL